MVGGKRLPGNYNKYSFCLRSLETVHLVQCEALGEWGVDWGGEWGYWGEGGWDWGGECGGLGAGSGRTGVGRV